VFEINGKNTVAKVMIDGIDQETMRQITLMANHPAATNPVAIMPDCHAGKGCVVGFTMKAGPKVVCNWIGVDIGCGMLSVNTGIAGLSDEKLSVLDRELRLAIPMGKNPNNSVEKGVKERLVRITGASEAELVALIDLVGMRDGRFWTSIGTLGGGNHFIELGVDEAGSTWLTIHSGSRNFGKRVCEFYDNMAQKQLRTGAAEENMAALKAKAERGEIAKADIGRLHAQFKADTKLTFDVKESAYLEGENLEMYLSSMRVAQAYAALNRQVMADRILALLGRQVGKNLSAPVETIETVHNYISPDDGVIRKGAVASYAGWKMVIPFNMRDGLLICEGKSNPEWNFSAPHGAGRVFSRRQAKDQILMEDYEKSMEGIFTTSVSASTLDESPMAYKDAAVIEAAIEPTAKILHRVKPIYNVKASE
jgi:tRNA-splicing ligase RtcB